MVHITATKAQQTGIKQREMRTLYLNVSRCANLATIAAHSYVAFFFRTRPYLFSAVEEFCYLVSIHNNCC